MHLTLTRSRQCKNVKFFLLGECFQHLKSLSVASLTTKTTTFNWRSKALTASATDTYTTGLILFLLHSFFKIDNDFL